MTFVFVLYWSVLCRFMLPNLVVLSCVSCTFSRLRSSQVPCPSCISTHTHPPILIIPSSLFLLALYGHLFHNHLALRRWDTLHSSRTSVASADRVSLWHDTQLVDTSTSLIFSYNLPPTSPCFFFICLGFSARSFLTLYGGACQQ